MTILESLSGCYRVELTAGDIARFLEQAAQTGLRIQEVSWENDLTIRFSVLRKDYKKLTIFVQRQGAQIRILNRPGLYWDAKNILKRPIFLFGMFLMLTMAIFLPGRIYFVEVHGNNLVETARILESASEFGIKFGASRRLVRSEQVKNQLIGTIPELGWVGVNTKGCVALISVREKEVQEPASLSPEPCNIVALRDGIILDCSATRGNLLCTVGQAVSEGDILISGSSSLFNVDTIAGASGEIFAATERHFSLLTPDSAWVKGENGLRKTNFTLRIGKNLINFFKGSGIYGATCVKMYSKYVLTLPGGFSLPVALIVQTTYSCELSSQPVTKEDAQKLLSEYASGYLGKQMIAGNIIRRDEILAQSEGIYQLTGDYACTEMIGRARKEQIGAYHGKTD